MFIKASSGNALQPIKKPNTTAKNVGGQMAKAAARVNTKAAKTHSIGPKAAIIS